MHLAHIFIYVRASNVLRIAVLKWRREMSDNRMQWWVILKSPLYTYCTVCGHSFVHGVSKGCYAYVLETAIVCMDHIGYVYTYLHGAQRTVKADRKQVPSVYHTTIYSANKSQIWEESLLLHSLKRLREREALNQNRTTRLSRSPDCFSPKREKQNQRTDEISVYTVSYYGKLQLTVTQTGMAPLRAEERFMCVHVWCVHVLMTV